MKAAVLLILALATALPAFAQYSARTLTRKIAPQPQQPARPVQPTYRPSGIPQTSHPAAPSDPAKVAAEKSKNEVKQLEFYKRRAEEGSDHAQYELGLRYLAGKGTEPNEKLGREWLEKSAKQGYAQAKKKLEELGPAKEAPGKPGAPVPVAKVSATPAALATPKSPLHEK